MLTNPTGEYLAIYNGFFVDAITVNTKAFPLSESLARGTEIVTWNGLIQSNRYYWVQNNTIYFNSDIPLMIGDEVGIKYFIGD